MPPSFCRHNRFVQNCPICTPREHDPEPRARPSRSTGAARGGGSHAGRGGGGVRVRRVVQAVDDGFRCELVAGLRASADAARLADEIAFASARLDELADEPPGPYAEIAVLEDLEEAHWLAFLVVLLCPTQDADDPFAAIRDAHVPWSSGELPRLDVPRGPRAQADPATAERTVLAYRAWAQRAGGQRAAFAGEPSWTPARRFDRLFERLSLPGLGRGGRYELLVSLGQLGIVDVEPSALKFGDDATTLAAKRVFGIGDTVLLERRAKALAGALDRPIEVLDLALFNWGTRAAGARATYGSRREVADGGRDAVGHLLGV